MDICIKHVVGAIRGYSVDLLQDKKTQQYLLIAVNDNTGRTVTVDVNENKKKILQRRFTDLEALDNFFIKHKIRFWDDNRALETITLVYKALGARRFFDE